MILFENENRKICIWKDEKPINFIGHKNLHLCINSGNNNWHVGTICIEVKLHQRHISNYAMVCMRYISNQEDKIDIIINYGTGSMSYKSQVLPFNKNVCLGLDREFAAAIEEFFKEYPYAKLPGGTIEILSGGYDEIGSSNVAFKKVMELLIFLFENIDTLGIDELKNMLLEFR